MRKIILISLLFSIIGILKADAQIDTVRIQTTAQCGDCKEAIEKQLNFEKGVKSADLNTETKIATVIYNSGKTNPEKLRKAISLVGYDADGVAADPKAVAKLKPCCTKDGHKHH